MENIVTFDKINNYQGKLALPGDKSISHRAVFFASMAKGESTIENISSSADVQSTINCFKELGAEIDISNDVVKIKGVGRYGFTTPKNKLDAGNSGTTSRLLIGLLSACGVEAEIIGDASLSKRPMKRIIDPLTNFGANIESNNGYLPVRILKNQNVQNFTYELPIASAQLKTSLILYGLHCDKESTIVEKLPSRNHTEVMLNLNVENVDNNNIIKFSSKNYPVEQNYFIPGDISSAAFFVVLTLLNENSSLVIENVSLNPTRTGFIDLLKQMNADITILDQKISAGEIYGNILVKSSKLNNIKVPMEIIPNIIDEIPILAIAAAFSEGEFIVQGAEELRVKECDRINAVCVNLKKVGIDVEEFKDGFRIVGTNKKDFSEQLFNSFDDHRIAMAFAVFSMINSNGGKIDNFDCVKISNPAFLEQVKNIIKS